MPTFTKRETRRPALRWTSIAGEPSYRVLPLGEDEWTDQPIEPAPAVLLITSAPSTAVSGSIRPLIASWSRIANQRSRHRTI
jgi:hypothetical protein